MLYEKNKEDSPASFRPVRFPKLLIFVAIFRKIYRAKNENAILVYLRGMVHQYGGQKEKEKREIENMYRVSIQLYKHGWMFGRTRNAVGTRATDECFHSFFEFSQTFKGVQGVHVFYFF